MKKLPIILFLLSFLSGNSLAQTAYKHIGLFPNKLKGRDFTINAYEQAEKILAELSEKNDIEIILVIASSLDFMPIDLEKPFGDAKSYEKVKEYSKTLIKIYLFIL